MISTGPQLSEVESVMELCLSSGADRAVADLYVKSRKMWKLQPSWSMYKTVMKVCWILTMMMIREHCSS